MAVLERRIAHGRATLCSHVSYPRFVLPLHKHADFEIMLFTRGRGKQFVGEGVSDFQAGDVALIGSNVPHLHLCATKLVPPAHGSGPEESRAQARPCGFARSCSRLAWRTFRTTATSTRCCKGASTA